MPPFSLIMRRLTILGVFSLLTACTVSGPSTSSSSSSSSALSQASSAATHTVQGPGFHITFDSAMFTLQAPQLKQWYFANSLKNLTGTSLVHRIAVQHCALSGNCTPTTDNPLIGIYVIDEPLAGIQAKAEDWQNEGPVTVDGRAGFGFQMGVEGEGERDIFAPLSASETLYITCSTINEEVMMGYSSEPAFVKLAQQQELCDQLLNNVVFE